MLLMNNKQEFNIAKEGVTILVEMVLHVSFPFENFAKINLFIRLRLNNSQCLKELWTKVFKQELEVTLVSIETFWVWDSLECNCKSLLIITFLCQFSNNVVKQTHFNPQYYLQVDPYIMTHEISKPILHLSWIQIGSNLWHAISYWPSAKM